MSSMQQKQQHRQRYMFIVISAFLVFFLFIQCMEASNSRILSGQHAIASRHLRDRPYPRDQYPSYNSYGGYHGLYGTSYGPVDSVQAQAARSVQHASNNAAVLRTINNNNHDLLNLPAQIMEIDHAVDYITQQQFGYGSSVGGYGPVGYLPEYVSHPTGRYPSQNAALTLQDSLYGYVGNNAYIGSSARVYDTVQDTHARFNQALGNVAADQRVAHELALSAFY